MRALKLIAPGVAEIREVEPPVAGDDEVLVRIEAAGVCHSDLHILHQDESWPFFGTTMGHESAGTIESVGQGVSGFSTGDRVLVHAIWSCGQCRPCRLGRNNACAVTGSRTQFPMTPGIAVDGGMAEYLAVNQRHLTRIGELSPVTAAPLADAGMTSMHNVNAIKGEIGSGATVALIGAGGLGHVALQILLALPDPPEVVVIDVDEQKRAAALATGAQTACAPEEASERVLARSGGYGVDAVLDFVGLPATLDLARGIVAPEGALRIVGLGGGAVRTEASVSGEELPWGVRVTRAYGGTDADQREIVDLANRGVVSVQTTEYPLADAARAFADLTEGRVAGRAVLIP